MVLPGDPGNAGPYGAASPWAYMPPPPEPGTRRRWTRWIVAGGICAVVVVGLAVLEGARLIEKAIQPPVPGASMLLFADYQPGDCLYDNFTLGSGPWPERQWKVPCTQPHAFEVFYANRDYWQPDAPYPGRATVGEQGDTACDRQFAAYDGLSPGSTSETSEYRYVPIVPLTSSSWARGSRELYCVAYYPTAASVDHEVTITHSIKGSDG